MGNLSVDWQCSIILRHSGQLDEGMQTSPKLSPAAGPALGNAIASTSSQADEFQLAQGISVGRSAHLEAYKKAIRAR